MQVEPIIAGMQRFPGVVRALLADVPDADLRWRPPGGAWSLLEIARHLLDEEREDFRPRLERTLRDTAEAWSPIDPEGWARERRYNEADPGETLRDLAMERARSVEWLRGLDDPDWSRAHEHPKLGAMSAGDLFVAWAAHDALHLRQVAKRLYQLTVRDGDPYVADYAGTWRE